jgi:hypothetical protein
MHRRGAVHREGLSTHIMIRLQGGGRTRHRPGTRSGARAATASLPPPSSPHVRRQTSRRTSSRVITLAGQGVAERTALGLATPSNPRGRLSGSRAAGASAWLLSGGCGALGRGIRRRVWRRRNDRGRAAPGPADLVDDDATPRRSNDRNGQKTGAASVCAGVIVAPVERTEAEPQDTNDSGDGRRPPPPLSRPACFAHESRLTVSCA